MQTSLVSRVLASLVFAAALLLPAARAQSARPEPVERASGIIEGRVFNAATGNALANARVSLDGSEREVVTDSAGEYRLTGVPVGPALINVSYLGMASQKASVNVTATGAVRREFELVLDRAGRAGSGDAVKLDAFTVVADREMSAQAISMNEQRTAPNIKNVVAMDEFGDRGAENIGEFLLFLPGVSVTTSGSEPTTVAMRGFPGNNTGLTIDGAETTGTFNGNSRSLDLREVPMNNVSRVEITKVPTPDMPASGLGGSINLITRNGFETKAPRFTYNVYTMFHNRNGLTFDGGPRNASGVTSSKYILPSFDFSYLRPINRDLAITIGGSRTWRAKPMETGTKDTDESPAWDQVRNVQTTSQWNSLAQQFRTLQGQIGIDYRLNSTDFLSLSGQYRSYALPITRSVLAFAYGAGATGGATFSQSAIPTGTALPAGTITMNGSGENVDILTQTKLYNFKYRHRGATWRIDFGSYYSTSGSDRWDVDAGFFNTTPATISNVILRGDGIPSSGGTIPTSYSATNAAGQAVDVYDGGNYSITSGNSNQPDWNTQRYNFKLDLAREFRGRIPFTLKVGGLIDTMQNDQRRYPRTWTFRPNGAADAVSRQAKNFDVFDTAYNDDAPTLFGRKVRWISGKKLYELYQKNPAWFVTDEAQIWQDRVNNSRQLSEQVAAAYLRADVRLLNNKLWLVTGVRFERTHDKGSGPLNDINAQYQRDASGRLIDGNPNQAGIQPVNKSADALTLRKLRYVERGATSDQHYSGYYPSLNASYTITENLILRAAYAQTLGRPNINNIIPSTSISDANAVNPTITVNNSGLKPWSAKSYDLSLESYQIKDGFGSVGVFQKEIKDFFTSVTTAATPELLELYGLESDQSLLSYNFTTLSNGGDAKIQGIEFTYRQSLTFLPHWARGLQVFANATKLNLSGSRTNDFSGYNPKSLSGGVNFIRGRLALKWTISYTGDVKTGTVAASATVAPNTFNYQAKRTRIGVNVNYSLTKRYSLYASLVDWGGFVQNLQRYSPTTPDYAKPTRWQELGYYTNVGIRGSF
ncbi:MAG: TonB-dependent receptor [Verrucomicrobia bacterium]|nr:TonB-dependent receptor [Verrucomicrobiota bacterium]